MQIELEEISRNMIKYEFKIDDVIDGIVCNIYSMRVLYIC